MTLRRFEYLLKKADSRLKLKFKGWGDVGGIFAGTTANGGYIVRMTKGDLAVNGYREQLIDPSNPMRYRNGLIKKRGRKTLVNILRNRRWLTTHKQRSMILWGIEPKESLEGISKKILLHG